MVRALLRRFAEAPLHPEISIWFEENLPGLDLHRVGFQVDADRRCFSFTGCEVEAAIVFGAFDDVALDEAAGEMNFCVGAQTIGRIKLVVGRSINGECAFALIETEYVLLFDIADMARLDPTVAHGKDPVRPFAMQQVMGW